MTIANKLLLLNATKTAIATAIEAKGVVVGSAPFADYAGKINEISSGGGGGSQWTRPPDWLQMPVVDPADSKLVMLVAVFPGVSNPISVNISGNGYSGSGYTADWGDGTSDTVTTVGVKNMSHTYDYDSLPESSYCSRGYRQAIITVYPYNVSQTTLQRMDNIYIAETYPPGYTFPVNQAILELVFSNPGSCSFRAGSTSRSRLALLEKIKIQAGSCRFDGAIDTVALSELDFTGVYVSSTASSTFVNCANLNEIPFAVYLNSNNFRGCARLQDIPVVAGLSTNWVSIFSGCVSLRSLPDIDTSGVIFMSSAFAGCVSLREIPAYDLSSVTSAPSFAGLSSLTRSRCFGLSRSHSYADCSLSDGALNEIFSNLPTVTGQTITISRNPGVATCNRSIATAKGWTVTG